MIMGALSITGACSSDESNGGTDAGGTGSGATSSEAGSSGDSAGTGSDAGGGGPVADLCEGLNLNCADDENPCTEDECNPATGKCGLPRTGTSCDDGLYCNGEDTCNAGECTEHKGNPCGEQTCNEMADECECKVTADCPVPVPGEWGECTFANACIETGTRSRPVVTFSCENGACAQDAAVETENCTRETDTVACTDDGIRCNGAEQCSNGTCTGVGNPCTGATPHCYPTGTMCRECRGNDGCGGSEKCCNGNCIPTANTCSIIGPTSTIIQSISTSISTISPTLSPTGG